MKTVQIPSSKLIKFIPSAADGGVIPGKVIRCTEPRIARQNAYAFELSYTAESLVSKHRAFCCVDEELEVVPGSNELDIMNPELEKGSPCLIDDGVIWEFKTGATSVEWDQVLKGCVIPDPFDALGTHQMSDFVRYGSVHIACCAPAYNLRVAVVGSSNLISSTIIKSEEPMTFGPPCQHNEGWIIPWQSKSKGMNIAWLTDAEMAGYVDGAGPLPK